MKQSVPFRRYRAFISYSTAADGRLAPALQRGLQRFAKPWFRLRALRVFRDATGLGVTPALWNAIEAALVESEYFILLASPEAAQSRWVTQEIEWWLKHRSADRLLLVLTSGIIAWDTAAADFDWPRTTALPRQLSQVFAREPFFLDLQWVRSAHQLTLRHPTFADAVARLAAPLHARPLDELIGEDIRQHRLTVRSLAIGASLLALVCAASLFAVFRGERAWRLSSQLARREQAGVERERSREQAAQWLVSSRSVRGTNPELAVLYAREALRTAPGPEAESALRQALAGDLPPSRSVSGPGPRGAYARFSPDGARLVTWIDEAVQLTDATVTTPALPLRGHEGDVLDAKFSPDGRTVVTSGDDETVRLWNATTGQELARFGHPGVTSARVTSDRSRCLTLAAGAEVHLWDVAGGKRLTSLPLASTSAFSDPLGCFSPDGSRVVISALSDPLILDARTGQTLHELSAHRRGVWSASFSSDGSLVITASEDGTARIWRVATGQCERVLGPESDPPNEFREARFSPDGRFVAVRTADPAVLLWRLDTGERVARLEPGGERGSLMTFEFSPSGACLLTASLAGDEAKLWETSSGFPLGKLLIEEGLIRTLSFAPESRRLVLGFLSAPARVYDCDLCAPADALLEVATRRVPRELTAEERTPAPTRR